jgi:hypothetical protein
VALAGGGPKVRVDPGVPYPGYARGTVNPPARVGPRKGRHDYAVQRHPVVVCDAYARCRQRTTRGGCSRAQAPDRFFRPHSGVLCDHSTRVCYRSGRADESETATYFGKRAADAID